MRAFNKDHNHSVTILPVLKFAHPNPALSDGHTRANMSTIEFFNRDMLIGVGTAVAGSSVGILAFFRAWSNFRTTTANDSAGVAQIERLEKEIERKDGQLTRLEEKLGVKDETINTLWREKSQLESKLSIIENNLEFLKEQNVMLVEQVKNLSAQVRELSNPK
jgi:septal ring factor EnvC (AmiA/AmiB activator)